MLSTFRSLHHSMPFYPNRISVWADLYTKQKIRGVWLSITSKFLAMQRLGADLC